jgi:hypothetical protein
MFSVVPGSVLIACYSRQVKEMGIGTIASVVVLATAFIPIFLLRDHLQHVSAGTWGVFEKRQMETWSIICFVSGGASNLITFGVKVALERRRSEAKG